MSKQTKQKGTGTPVVARGRKRPVPGKPAIQPHISWAVAIFAVVTVVFFWTHLFGNGFLWEDFLEFTYPNQVFAARNFMAGTTPFWNPFTFNGMPFIADLQNGYFYPPNMLMYLLSGGELSARLAQAFVALHYFVSMLGAWKLSRTLNIGNWGAIFSGISYGLGGMMVAQMIHPNMVFHMAWFPLIVAMFYKGVAGRSLFHALLSGLILGMTLLSGHPQSALFIVFFLFCLAVYQFVADLRSTDPARRRGLTTGLLAAAIPVAVGAGLFAVQLLPSQELAGLSERAEMTYQKSTEGSLVPGQLLTLVTPKVYGVATADRNLPMTFWLRPENYYFWETVIYIGVVTLLLACLGAAGKQLGGLRWFLVAMGALGLLYGLGNAFFIHPLLSKLPLFGQFRIPARMALYLALGGAVLAGAGLERVTGVNPDNDGSGPPLKILYIAGGLIVLLGLLTLTGVLPGILAAPAEVAAKVSSGGIIPLLIGGLSVAVIWAALKQKMPNTGVAISLLLLCTIDLFAFGVDQNVSPDDPQKVYQSNDAQFAALKANLPGNIFRVSMRDSRGMLMQRNQGPFSNIMLYEGYNPLLLARRVPPAATLDKSFDLLNIRYAIQVDSAKGTAGLAERATAYPHARMLYDVKWMDDKQKVKDLMKGGTVDFGKTVLLEHAPEVNATDKAAPPAFDGTGSGSATITRYDASQIDLSVTTDKPGVLLLSEIWYPAWQVTVDGKQQELLIADYSLRGVVIPAGKHSVTLRYESSAYSTGRLITLATLGLSLLGVVVLWFRRRKVTLNLTGEPPPEIRESA